MTESDPTRTASGCSWVFGPYNCAKVAGHEGEHIGAQAGGWQLTAGVAAGPQADLDALMADVEGYEAPSSTAEDLDAIVAARERLAEAVPALVAELRTLRAAGPQVTPQVLWEGETRPLPRATRYSVLPAERISVPPRTRVRVVAAPTSQEDDHG